MTSDRRGKRFVTKRRDEGYHTPAVSPFCTHGHRAGSCPEQDCTHAKAQAQS